MEGKQEKKQSGVGSHTLMHGHACRDLAAVYGVLKAAAQSHVVVRMKVGQKVGGAVWDAAIAEGIHHHTSFCM